MIGDILQPTHLLFVLVIALLVLGPKRLPEVGRSLGRGLRDFRRAVSGEDQGPETVLDQPPVPAPVAQPAVATPMAPVASAVTTPAEVPVAAQAAPAAEPVEHVS